MTHSTIIDFINQYGYAAIAFLIAIENVFPPIPSEVVLVFSGYLTIVSKLTVVNSIIAATLGALVGAAILYYVGRIFNVSQLKKFAETRVGKFLRLKSKNIDQAAQFFTNHGSKAILFGRCVPVVRSLISVPAGMVKYPLHRFIFLTTAGTLIWNTVLILVGKYTSESWNSILAVVGKFTSLILILFVIAASLFIVYKIKRPKKG